MIQMNLLINNHCFDRFLQNDLAMMALLLVLRTAFTVTSGFVREVDEAVGRPAKHDYYNDALAS